MESFLHILAIALYFYPLCVVFRFACDLGEVKFVESDWCKVGWMKNPEFRSMPVNDSSLLW